MVMMRFNKVFNFKIIAVILSILLLDTSIYASPLFPRRENLRVPLIGTKRAEKALPSRKDIENVSDIPKLPSLEELESKIFAVHATPILPKQGIMIAGTQASEDGKVMGKPIGNGIPAFRPTLHFSLGELARDGMYRDRFDIVPYAVVSPLKNLTNQLINIFPTDTFIIGDYYLSNGDILVVSKGTDISTIPLGIQIFEYEPKAGLRNAVNFVIQQQKGWHIHLAESFDGGFPAILDGHDVNSPEFFRALFERYPFLSYGSHAYSEKGDAFRFYHIQRILSNIIKPYISSYANAKTTEEIQLDKALALHNLSLVEHSLSSRKLPARSMEVFNENKNKLFEWLNLVDIDLEIRRDLGKTLASSSERIKKGIIKRKNNLKNLRRFVYQNLDKLSDLSHDTSYDIDKDSLIYAFQFCTMSPEELKKFGSANSEIFKNIDTPLFHVSYAIKRWLIVRTEQAKKEKLDQLLENMLGELNKSYFEILIYGLMMDCLTIETNRLEDALAILREPAARRYLADIHDIKFEDGAPWTLDNLLRIHPDTKGLFSQDQLSLDKETGVAYFLLAEFMKKYVPQMNTGIFISFREATSMARSGIKTLLEERLGHYNKSAKELWESVGLGEEFVQLFPFEDAFWASKLSLVEIYNRLKEIHSSSTGLNLAPDTRLKTAL